MYAKEQKGPVTAITNTQSGFLVTSVGQKVFHFKANGELLMFGFGLHSRNTNFQIYIWQLKDNDLAGIAFIDTQIYAHRLLSAKSLILVADVYKSITLLRFQEEFRTLSLVGRVSLHVPTCARIFLHDVHLKYDFYLYHPGLQTNASICR